MPFLRPILRYKWQMHTYFRQSLLTNILNLSIKIKKELFEKALKFAKSHMYISDLDVKTIYSARQSFLYHRDEPWVKVGSEDFDIPMGSNDRAECCELVGMYLLHSITQKSNGKILNLPGFYLKQIRIRILKEIVNSLLNSLHY